MKKQPKKRAAKKAATKRVRKAQATAAKTARALDSVFKSVLRDVKRKDAAAAKPSDWRSKIDWAAAGRKAYETKMRNLGGEATEPVAPAAAGPKPVRARLDKDAAAYEARVLASMLRSTPPNDRDRIAAQLGRDFGGGWICLGTDGIRALCRQGGEALKDLKPMELVTAAPPVNGIDLTPEFCDALRSLQLATKGTHAKKAICTIVIDGKKRTATLEVGPLDAKLHQQRVVKATGGKLTSLTLRVNLALLLDGCGRGGRLGYADGNKPLVLDTPDGLRYVVMGVRS